MQDRYLYPYRAHYIFVTHLKRTRGIKKSRGHVLMEFGYLPLEISVLTLGIEWPISVHNIYEINRGLK
jgi:hypothetical protein